MRTGRGIKGTGPFPVLRPKKKQITKFPQGRYDEAIEYSQKELKVAEEKYDPNHVIVAELLQMTGIAYQKMEKYAQAESFLKRSLEIMEKIPIYALHAYREL